MLKILQIANKAPYPPNDGSSIAIWNMARGLLVNGVKLKMLVINTKKHFKPDEGVPADFRGKTGYTSVYRNTNVTAAGALLNLFSASSYFVSRFYFGKFRKRLVSVLRKNDFDIIQLEGLFMGRYIPVIRANSRAKIVLRAHNIEHHIWKRHILQEKGLRRFYLLLQNRRLKRFELDVFGSVDAIVPISSNDESEIRKLLAGSPAAAKPVHPCIMGVDMAEYLPNPAIKEKSGTVFYFGSMDWLPNQEAVLWFLDNCWKTIHETVPSARLVIAGRGMPLSFFHITAPNVSIVENVDNGPDFFRQHQVMIVPLWSGSGLRIKIIEGMAHGKAIVSTSIGAEGTGSTNGRNIVIADTAEGFSRGVITLLSDHVKRAFIGKEASAFARQEFDNGRLVSRLLDFYGKLCHA